MVLKLHTVDQGLVLVPSVALTRQKYVTRLPRPATTADVPLTDWSETSVPNPELVDTWTRYEVAPVTAFQVSVGVLDTLGAPFDGETSVGAVSPGGGGAPNTEYRSRFGVPAGIPVITPVWRGGLTRVDPRQFDASAR